MQIDQHISMTHIDTALTRNKSIITKTKQTRLFKTSGKYVPFVALFSKSEVSKPQSALSSAALTSKGLNIIFVHLSLPLLLTICSHVIKINVYLVFEEVYTETKRITDWQPRYGKRSRGRQVKRWRDDIVQMKGITWGRDAGQRDDWRRDAEGYILQWMDGASV